MNANRDDYPEAFQDDRHRLLVLPLDAWRTRRRQARRAAIMLAGEVTRDGQDDETRS